jgi:hypothetical protein
VQIEKTEIPKIDLCDRISITEGMTTIPKNLRIDRSLEFNKNGPRIVKK